MIRSVRLQNWKSFEDATLELDELTVLIGLNASGKSNALDALAFLHRTVGGRDLTAALEGDELEKGVRGGVEWAATRGENAATLEVTVTATNGEAAADYVYTLTVELVPRVQVRSESLRRRRKSVVSLFGTDELEAESAAVPVRLYNGKAGVRRDLRRTTSVLSQLAAMELREEIREGVDAVVGALRGVFVLDPQPARIRSFAPLSESLRSDGSNVAGVLAGLPQERKNAIELRLAHYLGKLAEPDILAAWAEPVGKFNSDAMLYCRERFGGRQPVEVDARGMSDGTLRFVAILTALLTRPRGSLLVVEEIDNGLHPSRASLLLAMLTETHEETGVDVLVTTHNASFLDALPPELIPAVVVARRSPQSGASEFVVMETVANLPKLLALGPLGRAAVTGALERVMVEASTRRLTGT